MKFKTVLKQIKFLKLKNETEETRTVRGRLSNQAGMTLIEIMIVIAILAGLGVVLGGTVVNKLKKARVKNAQIQIGNIMKQLDFYFTDCGSYPESLDELVSAPEACSSWGPEPYFKKLPVDPWGHEFSYLAEGSGFTLVSLGADGREGGSSYDKDLSSEEL